MQRVDVPRVHINLERVLGLNVAPMHALGRLTFIQQSESTRYEGSPAVLGELPYIYLGMSFALFKRVGLRCA